MMKMIMTTIKKIIMTDLLMMKNPLTLMMTKINSGKLKLHVNKMTNATSLVVTGTVTFLRPLRLENLKGSVNPSLIKLMTENLLKVVPLLMRILLLNLVLLKDFFKKTTMTVLLIMILTTLMVLLIMILLIMILTTLMLMEMNMILTTMTMTLTMPMMLQRPL